jgi:hypothetical protein
MATNNSTNTSNPLTLAQGGTNASLTASNGGIVYSGSSALAVLAGTSTASQPLLSGASSAPSWASSTYPSTVASGGLLYGSATNTVSVLAPTASSVLTTTSGSVPQWSTKVPGSTGGSLQLISSQSASNSASISFTGLSSYSSMLFLTLDTIAPVTNAAVLQMFVSTNNGSSYITSGYTSGITYSAYNSATLTNKNSTSAILLSNTQSNSGANELNGFLYLYNINLATYFAVNGMTSWTDTTASNIVNTVALGAFSTTGVNAIQFSYSTGNILAGTFSLYSISQS